MAFMMPISLPASFIVNIIVNLRMNTEIINIKDLIEKIDKTQELKNETIKNDKYISPFSVPGYKDDDNLWEFVCDLISKDPLDDFLDKEEDKCFIF